MIHERRSSTSCSEKSDVRPEVLATEGHRLDVCGHRFTVDIAHGVLLISIIPIVRRVRIRTWLYPVNVSSAAASILRRPRSSGRLNSPMSFAQPKDSSISLRALMLTA